MKLRTDATLLVFLFLAIVASAQGVIGGMVMSGGPSGIKNKPYSADTVTITDRVLADGNRIHNEAHGRIFRDSEGRERVENGALTPPNMQPRTFITINDPIQRTWTTLQENNVTAIVNHLPDPEAELAKATKAAAIQSNSNPNPANNENMKIESKREDLGIQAIEGIEAQGYRVTRTFPAGFEGNERPITVVSETWRSEDLGIVVLSKNTDPRNGTSEHRLTNIQRSEPDPSLFRIPNGYSIKENKLPE